MNISVCPSKNKLSKANLKTRHLTDYLYPLTVSCEFHHSDAPLGDEQWAWIHSLLGEKWVWSKIKVNFFIPLSPKSTSAAIFHRLLIFICHIFHRSEAGTHTKNSNNVCSIVLTWINNNPQQHICVKNTLLGWVREVAYQWEELGMQFVPQDIFNNDF